MSKICHTRPQMYFERSKSSTESHRSYRRIERVGCICACSTVDMQCLSLALNESTKQSFPCIFLFEVWLAKDYFSYDRYNACTCTFSLQPSRLHGGTSFQLEGPLVVFGVNDQVSFRVSWIGRTILEDKVGKSLSSKGSFRWFNRPFNRSLGSKGRTEIGKAHEWILEMKFSKAMSVRMNIDRPHSSRQKHYLEAEFVNLWLVESRCQLDRIYKSASGRDRTKLRVQIKVLVTFNSKASKLSPVLVLLWIPWACECMFEWK